MQNSDLMTCGICMEPFDGEQHQAKLLDCHHSFCEPCLHCFSAKDGYQTVECPSCRHITPLTESGVHSLQSNFYISFMREMLSSVETVRAKGCRNHCQQPLSFFCSKCCLEICRDCTVIDHPSDHGILNASEAEQQQRQVLTNESKAAQEAMVMASKDQSDIEAELANLLRAKDAAIRDIEEFSKQAKAMIEAREAALVAEVAKMHEKRDAAIKAKHKQLGQAISKMATCLSTCDATSESTPLARVVDLNKQLKQCMIDMKSARTMEAGKGTNYLQVQKEAGMGAFTEALRNLGTIVTEKSLPSCVELSPVMEGEQLVAGLPVKLSMAVRGLVDTPIDHRGIGVKISDSSSMPVPVTLELQTQDTNVEHCQLHFTISFISTVSGCCTIQPTFFSHPMHMAPMVLNINHNNPVVTFGGKGQGHGKFHCPRAIQVDKSGNFYVADTGNHVIQKLNSSGEFVNQFRIDRGNSEYSTCDVALCEALDMIVCAETAVGSSITPTSGNTIAVYGRKGKLKNRFSSRALKCSLCVAVNSLGEIIVSDYLAHGLFMYDAKGTLIRQIGNPSSFSHPAFICIGKNDTIIVSDANNDTILIFNREGQLLSHFGKTGSSPGELHQPFGVATDGEDILVVDSGNNRIQVFKTDGTFVSVIDSYAAPFNQPRGVALTGDGHVYVADRDNHVIKKYRYK